MLEQLRYVRLRSDDLEVGGRFATDVLGLQFAGSDDEARSYRSDRRAYTLLLDSTLDAPVVAFSVRDRAALDEARERLARNGRELRSGSPEGAARRGVKDYASFTDHSGNEIELVVRPLDSGWRFHGARDAGVTGLQAVALMTIDVEADQALWTEALGARVSDWAGDTAYLAFDAAHHRIALHPAAQPGVLAVEYAVENVDLLMQNSYFLPAAQVRVLHGPGRRPTSGELFLTFDTPFGVLFSFVTEGEVDTSARRPRQFPDAPRSFDSWGSENRLPPGVCAATA